MSFFVSYRRIAVAALATACITAAVHGQVPSYATTTHDSAAAEEAAMSRVVSLDLADVPLEVALRTIATAARARLFYSRSVVPLTERVSLRANQIVVVDALAAVLRGTGLVARSTGASQIIIAKPTPPSARAAQQGAGAVAGRVTDANTHQPLAQATITVAGTTLGGTTRLDGTYRIRGVAPGTYRVTARRLGYSVGTHVATVADTGTAMADFALAPSAAVLDQVVTTVTGDEKRYQVGNLIETMAADSIVKTAPVTNLGDLLNARVPGLQVFEPGGAIGASPSINIRGQNSLTVSNQPLLYIDGVRVENSSANNGYGSQSNLINPIMYAAAFGGRLDDLNPDEIANIEVVKGPSAATLYGTDAANGVILVTTKRGSACAPRWDFTAEAGALTVDKSRFLSGYYAWGHTTDGTNTPERCTLLMRVAGSCVIDSVTHFSPLQDPATTIISTGYHQQYGAQVSGGGQQTRYFASGTYDGEAAPIKLPAADQAILARERGAAGLEPDNIRPNALTKASGRVNVVTALGPTADLTLSSGLTSQQSRIPTSYLWLWGQATPGYRDANDGWGLGFIFRPANLYALRNREDVTHVTGSAASSWRPTDWFTGRATTGIDYSSNYLDELARPGEEFVLSSGSRTNGRVNVALYTVDLGATATTHPLAAVSSKTSIGAQYNHRAELDNAAVATNLASGTVSVAGGAVQTATEANLETVITGGYAEQTFGLNDRFFLTGGLRADGGSAFGRNFNAALYPKASASWLVSQEPWVPKIPGVSSVRLRAAYGSSGVQPGPTDALTTIALAPATVDGGVTTTGGQLGTIGDPQLKPEKQTELEMGVDLDALDRRVQIAATYYNKKSTDALVNVPVGLQLGVASRTQEVNVGSVRNRGYEISANVEVIRSRPVDWSVGVNGSNNQNRLLKLAPGLGGLAGLGGGNAAFVTGYPLFGVFDLPILGYKDLNGDGVIEPNEVTVGPTPVYLGPGYPTAQLTAQSTVGVWSDAIQFRVQVDSRSGVMLSNRVLSTQTFFGYSRAQNDPAASLRDQAVAVATVIGGTNAGTVENGSFTRLREVSITYAVPPRVTRFIHGRSASLTLAGRNLALWTRYGGADPEVNSVPLGGGGGYHGAYYDYGAAPSSRYWIARVRVGL